MFSLQPLPFAKNALEPFISEKTLNFHYGKHHQAYLDNLNKLLPGSDFEGLSLKEIIHKTANNPKLAPFFNNAAQVFNHDFFWQSVSPDLEKQKISESMLTLINNNFNSLEDFLTEFKSAALTQFGSGWAWLVQDGEVLKIIKTANAENPLTHGFKPLFTIDVWEHAYYLDYQNRRADFIDACLKFINWEFVEKNYLEKVI